MLLDDRKWRYSQKGWTSVFRPVSSCTLDPVDSLLARKWSGSKNVSSADIIALPIIDNIERYLPYLPQSFPADLASDLIFAHSYPPAWWIGQLAKYLMQPSDELLAHLAGEDKRLVLPNWRPLVGVHVRRTWQSPRRGPFAPSQRIHALGRSLFQGAAFPSTQSSITSPSTLLRTRVGSSKKHITSALNHFTVRSSSSFSRYSMDGYILMANEKVAESAQLSSRYSEKSLFGIIADIHILSKSEYLVCTFSSQVFDSERNQADSTFVIFGLPSCLRTDASAQLRRQRNEFSFVGRYLLLRRAKCPWIDCHRRRTQLSGQSRSTCKRAMFLSTKPTCKTASLSD